LSKRGCETIWQVELERMVTLCTGKLASHTLPSQGGRLLRPTLTIQGFCRRELKRSLRPYASRAVLRYPVKRLPYLRDDYQAIRCGNRTLPSGKPHTLFASNPPFPLLLARPSALLGRRCSRSPDPQRRPPVPVTSLTTLLCCDPAIVR